ncbi:MAG: VWA domain-containing protein [Acidobacteriaceae bacterium]|nr:VWA domain-containing protein [Acidobacteriaceae bacterium]
MKWALVILAATAYAQEPTFKTKAHEVVVPVSVMTKLNKPVENLRAEDFEVLSDERPQQVRMVLRDSTPLPIYAVIVLQIGGAVEPALAKVKKTASVVSSYITNDMDIGVPSMTAVVTVGDEVKTAQRFTADPDILGDAFAKLAATGSSSRLIDGVSLACDLLAEKKDPARRVIVLISESRDLGSKGNFSEAVIKAQRTDVAIYTISYSAFTTAFTERASDSPEPPSEPGLYDPDNHGGMNLLAIPMLLARLAKTNVAQAFAQSTGGSHEKFTTLHGLETKLTVIGAEIHNRYVLAFTPPESPTPGYHEISVRIRRPGDFRVHARAGYWENPK